MYFKEDEPIRVLITIPLPDSTYNMEELAQLVRALNVTLSNVP